MSETVVEVSPVDVLVTLQRVNKTEEQVRQHWLNEILGLAQLLTKNQGAPEGLTYGALGGLQYAIRQLQHSYGCRHLDELEERYAEDELRSYPTSKEEADRTCAHFFRPGMDMRIDKCNFPDGVRYRVYVHSEYFQPRQGFIAAGTTLASVDREFPPLSQVHKHF